MICLSIPATDSYTIITTHFRQVFVLYGVKFRFGDESREEFRLVQDAKSWSNPGMNLIFVSVVVEKGELRSII